MMSLLTSTAAVASASLLLLLLLLLVMLLLLLLLLQAAAIQWPDIFQSAAAEAAKPQLVEQMRAVRPVVETG
jgi:hypothetical protein